MSIVDTKWVKLSSFFNETLLNRLDHPDYPALDNTLHRKLVIFTQMRLFHDSLDVPRPNDI